jgi:hypothetical protein
MQSRTSETTPNPLPYLSISRLRAFHRCSRQYYLRYVLGPQLGIASRPGSAALWGSMGHKIIQLAYHRIPLQEAHQLVWKEVCGPVLAELEEWYDLDREYRRVRGAATRNAEWIDAHPRYGEAASICSSYQGQFLSRWRWRESKPLTDFFRWSKALTRMRAEELLLPNPILVEGRQPSEASLQLALAARVSGFDGEEPREQRSSRMMFGTFEGVPVSVGGIPDVIALGDDGLVFADYKFSRVSKPEDVEEDLQLLLYVELARQQGLVNLDRPVKIGHIYPTEKGVVQVWADTSQLDVRLGELQQLFADMAEDVAAGRFRSVRGIDHFSVAPCGMCDMAHLCPRGNKEDLPAL